ncbi:MAG TPA: helix-turn-helix domain-containing protein [Rhodanobacteraceae bacterium]|nr:helix-turn-helix domain-containing protein [Rhodanobacteraceae bacterium]
MPFLAVTPAPPLDALIETIWDWDMPMPSHHFDRILALPHPTIIINLADDSTRVYADEQGNGCRTASSSTFSGPYTHSFVIDALEQVRVMGVVFRPGCASAFMHHSIDSLSNADTDLVDLFGPDALRLRQQLLEASLPTHRTALLEQWLCSNLIATPDPLVMYALDTLARAPQTSRIDALTADCGVSPRRLGNLFRQHVGMTPKRYARLLRFQAVVADAHHRRHINWARVAVDGGFHDQAHLSHEFRTFSGMSPGTWLARRGPHINHVPP